MHYKNVKYNALRLTRLGLMPRCHPERSEGSTPVFRGKARSLVAALLGMTRATAGRSGSLHASPQTYLGGASLIAGLFGEWKPYRARKPA